MLLFIVAFFRGERDARAFLLFLALYACVLFSFSSASPFTSMYNEKDQLGSIVRIFDCPPRCISLSPFLISEDAATHQMGCCVECATLHCSEFWTRLRTTWIGTFYETGLSRIVWIENPLSHVLLCEIEKD